MAKKRVLSLFAILATIEDTAGLYKDPADTEAIPAQKGEIWTPDVSKEDIDPLSNVRGARRTEVNANFATVPIKIDMRFPANHTHIAPLLQGCGVVGTVADNITTYRFNSTNEATLSLKQVAKRETTKVSGARGSFKISCKAGESAKIEFDLKANLQDVIELAPGADDNVIANTPDVESVFMTKDCTAYLVNGNAASFKEIELDLGGDIVVEKETCSLPAWIKDIKPELKVKMSVTPDNEGAFSDLKSGKEFSFVIPLFDIDGVKKYEIIAPKCVVIDNKKPDKDGVLSVERTLECRKVNGDDNFEIKAY